MDYIDSLHELCETIANEVGEANEKIRSAGGKLSAGDVDYIDKLTHAMKSIKATIAMMEEEEGHSNRSYADGGVERGRSGRGSYRGSYEGGSYRSMRRDRMGRYSRTGDIADRLRDLMEQAPNDAARMELERLADKMAQM